MRLIDADALREDCKRYLGTLNPDKDGKECTRIHWLIGVLENAPTIEPEPCEDAISRQRLLNDLKELIVVWGKYPVMAEPIKGIGTAIGYAAAIPSVTPKSDQCEDAVSRKSILDKISEKDNWEKYDRYNLGLSDARRIVQDEPSVTPKLAPCEDTVSRKTAVDALDEAKMIMMSVIDSLPGNVKNEEAKIRIETISATVDSVKQILEKLPSVTPERKTGKWKPISDGYLDIYECDQCSETEDYERNYCPNCGADMRGERE